MRFHASCIALGYDAVLLLGPSGAGKSDLSLRLIDAGFWLVADDQVLIEAGVAQPVPGFEGLLEVRGMGIFRLPCAGAARVKLAVQLGEPAERLPSPAIHPQLAVPLVSINAHHASAVARVKLALDEACGRIIRHDGAFAA